MDKFVEGLEGFLEAMSAEPEPPETGGNGSGRPFVTISRQAGAGGHALAEALLAQMNQAAGLSMFRGWRMFDREIVEMVASNPKLRVYVPHWREREYRSEIDDILARMIGNVSPQSQVLAEMFGVVRALAARGKVILLGRGGACLTRGLPGGLHIRLVAPLPARIRRMTARLNLAEKEAARVVEERDKSRAALVRRCFNRDIDDPLLYDVVWNTERTAPDVIASTVLRLVEHKARAGALLEDRVIL